jgi:hypothetical protein
MIPKEIIEQTPDHCRDKEKEKQHMSFLPGTAAGGCY